jgi:hypothetical protein
VRFHNSLKDTHVTVFIVFAVALGLAAGDQVLDIAVAERNFKLEYVVHFKENTAPEAAIDANNAVGARDGIVAELRRGAEPAGPYAWEVPTCVARLPLPRRSC